MIESLFVFIIGTIIGSFLNAVIWRMYVSESVVRGRSKCVTCSRELSASDLIPIISFIFLKGKCRYCKKPISWQYPLLELLTGILFVLAYTTFLRGAPDGILFAIIEGGHGHDVLLFARDLVFVCILLVLLVYDARWYLLPDIVTLPGIVFAFAINLLLSPTIEGGLSLFVGAAVGAGVFAFQYLISRGVWIGGGDIRLGALMGAMLGFPGVLYALFLAYMSGAAVAVCLLALKKKGMKSEIPFGPFLCAATLVMILYGSQVARWFHDILAL